MPAVLRTLSGDHFHDLAVIQPGADLILGRSPEANISVSTDPKISSNHLRIIASQDAFQIEDLGSTNGTFLNNEQVTIAKVQLGDMFRCGETNFVIMEQDNAANPRATVAAAPMVTSLAEVIESGATFCEESPTEILTRFEIGADFPFPPEPNETVADYALRLSNSDEPNHCLVFMSYALEKRASVWWLAKCIEQVNSLLDDNDREMLQLVEEWVVTPTDVLRRKAMSMAEILEMSTPACWAGIGAFWSGGSMAPENAPPVEPQDNLAGKAVSGGAILASVFNQPEKAFEKQKDFITLGNDIASGNLPWEN